MSQLYNVNNGMKNIFKTIIRLIYSIGNSADGEIIVL